MRETVREPEARTGSHHDSDVPAREASVTSREINPFLTQKAFKPAAVARAALLLPPFREVKLVAVVLIKENEPVHFFVRDRFVR
jgi:hypothetical protein